MNNLKFRVWDKKKKMFTNYQIVDDMLYFMDKITGVWLRDDNQDRFALMQSTGLKDKNGKEIFEGDIVSRFQRTVEEVVWNSKKGWWAIQTRGEIGLTVLAQFIEAVEIIGNIYENKELMGNENKSRI
nr:MAG TPA: YopX protein [Caudoviricetes sp.]